MADNFLKILPPPPHTEEENDEWWARLVSSRRTSSMINWWPVVERLQIPSPATKWYMLREVIEFLHIVDGEPFPEEDERRLRELAALLEYPLFLRTDHFSGKHNWKECCFVEREEDVLQHIANLVSESMMRDLPLQAFFFRKYIPFDPGESFLVPRFNDMPIRRERRIFIRDGQVEEILPYWPAHAIASPYDQPPDQHWRYKLRTMNDLSSDDPTLQQYAQEVARAFDGYWSVDFMWAQDKWWLIDMAEGEMSWHPTKRP